jgi:hypothetical protein
MVVSNTLDYYKINCGFKKSFIVPASVAFQLKINKAFSKNFDSHVDFKLTIAYLLSRKDYQKGKAQYN